MYTISRPSGSSTRSGRRLIVLVGGHLVRGRVGPGPEVADLGINERESAIGEQAVLIVVARHTCAGGCLERDTVAISVVLGVEGLDTVTLDSIEPARRVVGVLLLDRYATVVSILLSMRPSPSRRW